MTTTGAANLKGFDRSFSVLKQILMGLAVLGVALAVPIAASGQANDTVTVVFETDMGNIAAALYPDRAPKTVANFLAYVDGGHYDGAHFYRVVRPDNDKGHPAIRVIQGGIDGTGKATPFPPIDHEPTDQTGIAHQDGTISMARDEPGSATSEFFITIGDQPSLDAGGRRNPDGEGFAAFGRVIEGMAVVRAINAINATAPVQNPYIEDQILSVPVKINRVRRR